jgi:hypothetical protein
VLGLLWLADEIADGFEQRMAKPLP